jgi:tRNA(Ile2) C34 agmatinyltransferase TiaS
MPNCVDCGLYFKEQGCPAKRCPTCGKECHDNQYEKDEMEWDECDECPYIPDTIDYEKLERYYPSDIQFQSQDKNKEGQTP